MKKLSILVTILTFSTLCYSQDSSSEKVSTKNQIDVIAEDEVDAELKKVDATDTSVGNEYTNNPESTGSVKQIVNGKEIYTKETTTNGVTVTISTDPN